MIKILLILLHLPVFLDCCVYVEQILLRQLRQSANKCTEVLLCSQPSDWTEGQFGRGIRYALPGLINYNNNIAFKNYFAHYPISSSIRSDQLKLFRCNNLIEYFMNSVDANPDKCERDYSYSELNNALNDKYSAGKEMLLETEARTLRSTSPKSGQLNIQTRIFDSDSPPPGNVFNQIWFSNIANGGGFPDNHLFSTVMDTRNITGLSNVRKIIKGPGNQKIAEGMTGFNGLQEEGDQFGIAIDTRAIKGAFDTYWGRNKGQPWGLTATTIATTPRTPWRPWLGGEALEVQMELRLPFAGGATGGGSHLDTYFTVRDRTSGTSFIWGVSMFDTRPGALSSTIINNLDNCGPTCTGLKIFTVPLRYGSPYVSVCEDNTVEASYTTWSDMKRIHFRFTATNLRSLLNHVKISNTGIELSDNTEDYEVIYWNLNPEVFTPLDLSGKSTGDGWIGISGRILNVGPL